ncbi:MAG: hypothetical protein COB42_05795, partial [Sulfurimonas sp.]
MMILKYLTLLTTLLLLNAYAIVGATKGSADVAQGNFTYDLEIITPKGIAGLSPSLSLNYNSANTVNSIFGVGFSLSGLSSIAQCNETLFSEKADTSRDFNYCLDGSKLLLVNEAQEYGADGTEYKTEVNSHSKIIKTQSGWLVYSKDGLIHEFGNTVDSNDGEVFYKINKITDRYNNSIDFIYASGESQRYIQQITYADNSIDFIYENRTDTRKLYARGVEASIDKRVKTISVKTANEERSSYKLNYEYKNNFSRITDIQECVNGECLESVEFGWEGNVSSFDAVKSWLSDSNVNLSSWNLHAQDMNGDGLADLVQTYKG